jgi:hypothetical protein
MTELEQLAAAVRQLQERGVASRAELDADQCMLVALVMSHPDLQTLREAWQEASSEWTADRLLKATRAPEDQQALAQLASSATQRRVQFWAQVIDQVSKRRGG